jgi:hypothetical protein
MSVAPASFQLLFGRFPEVDQPALQTLLRGYHAELAGAEVKPVAIDHSIVNAAGPPVAKLFRLTWNEHAIDLALFDAPMPAMAIEACLQAALLPEEVKADARNHKAHALLYYRGAVKDPVEERVALACAAAILAEHGAIVVLNEEARAAILATDLLPDAPGEDMLAVLRSLPLPYLYAGFAKLLLTNLPGVWMRTFAGYRLGLPDLAYRARGHEEGQATFGLFSGLLGYLRSTGLEFEDGETVKIDESRMMTVRKPIDSEWWLDSPGPVWVLEAAESVR